MFSEIVEDVLRRQGWSPDRTIDIDHWVAALTGAGCTVLPDAQVILQNFGGLYIRPVKLPNDAYEATSPIEFDPVTSVLWDVDGIQYLQYELGQVLTPLGILVDDFESILLLGQNGSIYCLWGNLYGICGTSFEDALESTLLFARRRPEIHGLTPSE